MTTDYIEWRLSWIRAKKTELDRKWRESGYADADAHSQWVKLYEEGNKLKAIRRKQQTKSN